MAKLCTYIKILILIKNILIIVHDIPITKKFYRFYRTNYVFIKIKFEKLLTFRYFCVEQVIFCYIFPYGDGYDSNY